MKAMYAMIEFALLGTGLAIGLAACQATLQALDWLKDRIERSWICVKQRMRRKRHENCKSGH